MNRKNELHPPDRGHLPTEHRNPRTTNIDALDVGACVRLINSEDRTVADAVARAANAIIPLIEDIVPRMRRGGRLIYIGAGTSGRLGVLDASECPPTFQSTPDQVIGIIAGGDAALRRSSELLEDNPAGAQAELEALALTQDDTLLGIAAGGTTPYVLGALDHAHHAGALTALLTCAPILAPPAVRHSIFIETGPEVITGSTRMKAGTATKLVLNTITTTVMIQLGKVHENLMVDLRATNAKLRDRAARIIMALTPIDRAAAFALLEAAQGSVKHAILMHHGSIGYEDADAHLARAGGRLRTAIESQPPTPPSDPEAAHAAPS